MVAAHRRNVQDILCARHAVSKSRRRRTCIKTNPLHRWKLQYTQFNNFLFFLYSESKRIKLSAQYLSKMLT